jgi:hypothetical protein
MAQHNYGFTIYETIVVVLVGVLVVVGVHWHQTNQLQVRGGQATCSVASKPSRDSIKQFISSYQTSESDSVKITATCGGAPSQGGYTIAYTLTTNKGNVTDSYLSYADASPASPAQIDSCLLASSSQHTTLNCGDVTFKLN